MPKKKKKTNHSIENIKAFTQMATSTNNQPIEEEKTDESIPYVDSTGKYHPY